MKTIYLRIWIPVIVLALTTLLIVGMIFFQTSLQTKELKRQRSTYVSHIMLRLQRFTEEALRHQHTQLIEKEISSLGVETEIDLLLLVNPKGVIQYSTRYEWKNKKAENIFPEFKELFIKQAIKPQVKLSLNDETNLITAYLPILYPHTEQELRPSSYGYLYLHYNLQPALNNIWNYVLAESGLLWLSCLLLMMILMVILGYFVNRPINHLMRVMKHSDENKLLQANLTGNGEITVLSNTFNQLMSRFEESQKNLKKQKELYSILSTTNQLIIRITSQKELFDEICNLTSKQESIVLAWIGLVNVETKKVEVAAKAGIAENYLSDFFISTNPDISEGQGATGIAIRNNEYVVYNHFLEQQQDKPWYQKALENHIHSSAAFPITKFGDVVGSFNVYSSKAQFFNQDVIKLLDEMSNDISYALESLKLEEYRQQAEAALLEKEEKLLITLDSIGDGVIVTNAQGEINRMNPVAQELTGWSFSEAEGRLFSEVFHIVNSITGEKIENPIENVLKQQKIVGLSANTMLISKDGLKHQIADSAAPIFDKTKQLIGVVIVFQNITEQYQTHQALQISEQRFRDVIDASGAYIWELNKEGEYTYLTNEVEKIKGYKLNELMGHKPYEFMLPEDAEKTHKIVNEAIKNKGRFELTFQNITPEKIKLWEEVKGQVVLGRDGEIVSIRGVGVSINQRKEDEAEIERLAYYDSLTGLPNRRMLTERLKTELSSALRHQRYGALLFLDLDHFKNLNDSLGHAVGDELLIKVAKRLKKQLRKEDLAARLGGDEFIILLSYLSNDLETAIDRARKITEKVLTLLQQPYELKNHFYYSNSSIGITLFPQASEDAVSILKQADIALYRAKDLGRNTFQFYRPEMQETAYKRLEMEKNLRVALQEDQLELFYQPQTDHLGELIGAEVLLRWFLPDKGMVPPDQFIEIAEEAGLIIEIGLWIFKKCFLQVREWLEKGVLKQHQHISINVSPKQFKQKDFVEQLLEIVESTGTDPNYFILEVTEGSFLTNINDTIEKMLHLRGLGFKFSIDDFGTGYSSLSYLKRLPLNELKIDKSFIDDVTEDKDDQVIVKTIISMAKHLQFSVIAEGVEDKNQLDFLKQHGCLHYQGYFFSKPLNHKDFSDYLNKQTYVVSTDKLPINDVIS